MSNHQEYIDRLTRIEQKLDELLKKPTFVSSEFHKLPQTTPQTPHLPPHWPYRDDVWYHCTTTTHTRGDKAD